MAVRQGPLEARVGVTHGFWRGRRVLVTGHTGFKGGWLALWLTELGAEVHGFALTPSTEPSFSTTTGVDRQLASSETGDVTDWSAVDNVIQRTRPEVVLHLAAQALVRASYECPVDTFRTNVMGTVHLLDAARCAPDLKAIVNVTTDKCYENREWVWPYREGEAMGGHDPYSASKGCSELVTAAYRRSFLAESGIAVATARAGNVIGGGDWSADRLVPDLLRAADSGQSAPIRAPRAIRPWQHVLEPLSGYLALAEALVTRGGDFADAWNFGPADDDAQPVEWLAARVAARVPGAAWHLDGTQHPHEAHTLRLDSSRARALLGWRPRWTLDEALEHTIAWHLAWREEQDMASFTLGQIRDYQATSAR